MTKKSAAATPSKKRRAPRHPPVPPEISSARKYAAYQMRIMNPHMTFAAITVKLNDMFPDYQLKSEHQAVEKMIKEAEKEYIDTHMSKVNEIKAEAGAALDWVRKEAADAWGRSQDLLKIIKKKEDQTVEQILKAEIGNAQFLKRITETVEVKTKIFGAQAPRKHEVTGKDGSPLGSPSIDMKRLGKFLSDGDLDILQKAAEVIARAQRDADAASSDGD
jgi:hypothetical protein